MLATFLFWGGYSSSNTLGWTFGNAFAALVTLFVVNDGFLVLDLHRTDGTGFLA
jgi:hypothetical protein